MQISTKDWKNYIAKLSKLNATAAEKMQQYIANHGFADTEAIIDYAYGLVTKYGEGSAALSAQMFETIAEMEGAIIQPAVMAPTASRNEVAKMVNGIMKQTQNENVIANAVGRKVKQAGADTTLQNALRYGAEFAWIPAGDTCAFCIALASRGWQLASKKAIKNGHAEHIHSNCDCTYAIRFDSKTHIEGYDPKYYERMYYDAQDRAAEEGTFWSGKSDKDAINQMRRDKYKLNAEKIREQHRQAYAKRKGLIKYDNEVDDDPIKDITESFQEERKQIAHSSLKIEDGVINKTHKEEIDGAKWLTKNFNGDITVKAEVRDKISCDYYWDKQNWERKGFKSSKYGTIDEKIRHACKQIEYHGGMLLDFSDSALTIDEAKEICAKSMRARANNGIKAIIKKDNQFKVLEYIK